MTNIRRLFLYVGKSASMSASSLNFSSATRSITAKKALNSSGVSTPPLAEPLCPLELRQESAVIIPHASSHPIVELVECFCHRRQNSEASEHLLKKCTIDRAVCLLQVDENRSSGTRDFISNSCGLRTANIISVVERCRRKPHYSSSRSFFALK